MREEDRGRCREGEAEGGRRRPRYGLSDAAWGPKPKAERGPAGPQGPPGPCVDIDTVGVPGSMSGAEYSAALTRGRTYVGYRSAPTGAYAWKDLTNYRQTPGYPRNACGVSVKVADRVYVKVLTTAGAVFETSCTLTLTCTLGWAAVINP